MIGYLTSCVLISYCLPLPVLLSVIGYLTFCVLISYCLPLPVLMSVIGYLTFCVLISYCLPLPVLMSVIGYLTFCVLISYCLPLPVLLSVIGYLTSCVLLSYCLPVLQCVTGWCRLRRVPTVCVTWCPRVTRASTRRTLSVSTTSSPPTPPQHCRYHSRTSSPERAASIS